jgi:hypothetical protein
MIGDGIHEDALRHLVQQHAVREVVVGRINGGPAWGLSIRLGGPTARLVPVRSRREAVRTWASLTAVGKFSDHLGLKGFAVEL